MTPRIYPAMAQNGNSDQHAEQFQNAGSTEEKLSVVMSAMAMGFDHVDSRMDKFEARLVRIREEVDDLFQDYASEKSKLAGLYSQNAPNDGQFQQMAKHASNITNAPGTEEWQKMGTAPKENPEGSHDGAQHVTFWKDGLTIDDGPFRPWSDPVNQKFADDIARGQCPAELKGATSGGQVPLTITDRRGEDYVKPGEYGNAEDKIREAAAKQSSGGGAAGGCFGGCGDLFMLQKGRRSVKAASITDAIADSKAGDGIIVVDPSKERTKVQIAFHDGSLETKEFNKGHTVGDLQNYCVAKNNGQPVFVVTGQPPKPLMDNSQTLQAAGVCGARVRVQNAAQ